MSSPACEAGWSGLDPLARQQHTGAVITDALGADTGARAGATGQFNIELVDEETSCALWQSAEMCGLLSPGLRQTSLMNYLLGAYMSRSLDLAGCTRGVRPAQRPLSRSTCLTDIFARCARRLQGYCVASL